MRATYLSRVQLLALETACVTIYEALTTEHDDAMPYLVGTALVKPDFRDVDVRVMVADDRYDRLDVREWRLLNLTTSAWLTQVTGLPVDFQIQRLSEANAAHSGRRQPLAMTPIISHFPGDAEPEKRK